MTLKIEYDEPIEVTREQYILCLKECCGSIAHREEDGHYFIKVWYNKEKVIKILNQ